jgi:tetratricopeptide (TPR) repeat protein
MDHGKKVRVVTPRGVFYLEIEGRPDGAEAVLPQLLAQSEQHPSSDFPKEFKLDDLDAQRLGEEAFLYRLRREYFYKVGDYPRAIRDVNTGIQIIDMITTHTDNPELRAFFLQFRPDQEIFRRTAEARLAIQQKDYALARLRLELAASFARDFKGLHPGIFPKTWLKERLDQLKKVYDEIGEMWENDLSSLRHSALTLEQQLDAAIEFEQYERAAELRDMIQERKASGEE